MARLPRFVIPGQPQHVIQRGNNKEPIFYNEADYMFYLEKLMVACEKHSCDLHAYVLMENHAHLLMTPHTENGLGKVMQSLGRYYVQYFNAAYERTGTLWEGRYRATLLDPKDYLLMCMRYIELNPVRTELVKHPRDYLWSSYRYNALGEEDAIVTPHAQYKKLGTKAKLRQSAYRTLFRRRLSQEAIDELREATNKSWVLGNERFIKKIEPKLNRQALPKRRGGDRRSESFIKQQ